MPISSTRQQAAMNIASATPGNSAIGDAAAEGTSTSVARADHKHGRESAAAPGSSAVGDSASAGSATTIARSDHVHGREAFGTPVAVNAQTTSLSAGSLTTVARADHVHTLSNVGSTLIYSTTLGTAASSVTISNIPQTYSHLILIMSVRSAYAGLADYNAVLANSDVIWSNSNYAAGTGLQSYWNGGVAHGATNYYSSQFSTMEMRIYNYTASTHKHHYTSGLWNNSTTGINQNAYLAAETYIGGSAITSLKITSTTANNYAVGSIFRLYGVA